jgi:hypothetical protein
MGSMEFDRVSKRMIYHPSAKDILISLSDMPHWCQVLHDHSTAPYKTFLQSLINKKFYDENERIVIGKIAREHGIDQAKIKKWMLQIYEDIFDLNYENPELFKSAGTRHTLLFSYFRSHCALYVWLEATPRKYESVQMDFVRAKLDCYSFSVRKIIHEIQKTGTSITLFLDGGIINPYRDWLIERALFERELGFLDESKMTESEMDDLLRKLYK